jgi:hypothetical protein
MLHYGEALDYRIRTPDSLTQTFLVDNQTKILSETVLFPYQRRSKQREQQDYLQAAPVVREKDRTASTT